MGKKAKKSFQSVKGMADILPQDQKYWEAMRKATEKMASRYGFDRIDTPVVEEEGLFKASAGETSDLVEKQMYSFKSKGGDMMLVLRPEGTAPIMRAYLEHGLFNLPQPLKFFYIGPFFRYEQPQGGRYRQFHQFGFEMLGEQSPVGDAQLVSMFMKFLHELGFKGAEVHINSIGCRECRPKFRVALISYYRHNVNKICKDCRNRVKKNPLRVLDCKDEKCIQVKQQAPQTLDYLCEDCRGHFKSVLEYLDELEIMYTLNTHLVRGLDYYNKTVFEFFIQKEKEEEPEEGGGQPEAALLAVGGGGRFDYLGEMIGGRKVPAVGVAGGLERMVYYMKKYRVKIPAPKQAHVFLAQLGEMGRKKSVRFFEELSDKGMRVAAHLGKDSIKTQLRIAAKMGVKFTLILGQKEALEGNIILRDMESGIQEQFPIESIIDELKKRLRK